MSNETSARTSQSRRSFVGRDEPLARIRQACDDAREGAAQTVVVHGPAGIGKTALVDLVTTGLSDVTVVRVSGAATGTLVPFGLAERLLLALSGSTEPRSRSSGGDRLSWYTPAAVGGRLLGAVDELAEERLLVVVLDDLQLCDRESMEAILFAQRRLVAESVVSVFCGRADPAGWMPTAVSSRPSRTHVVDLTGLTGGEVDDLVAATGVIEPWTSADGLAAATAGNPLHLQVLLSLTPPARARHLLGDGGIPTPLPRLLAEQVAGHGGDAWRVAATLAVSQAPLRLDDLRRASDLSVVDDAVDALREDGIIAHSESGARGVWFSTYAYATAVDDALDPAERAQCHLRLVAVTTGFEQLRHRVAAADAYDDGLVDDLIAAAAAESGLGSLDTAARCRLWASQLTSRPDLRARLACEAIRSFVVAADDAQALALAPVLPQLPETSATMEARAALTFAEGRLATARDQLVVARDRADSEGAVETAVRVRLGLAYVDCLLGRGRDAEEAALRVLDHRSDLTRPTALAFLALARALQDGPSAGLDRLSHLPASSADLAPTEMPALVVRGQLRGLAGDLGGAVADLSAGVRRRGSVGGRVLGLGAHVHLTWAQYFAGSWDAARRTLDVARETSASGARRFDLAVLHSLAAVLAAGAGDEDTARDEADRAEQLARAADFDGPIVHVSIARASIAQALDAPAEVIEHLVSLRPPRIGPDRHRLNATLWLPTLIDAFVTVGDTDSAAAELALFSELVATGTGGDDAGLAVPLAWSRGRVLEGRGETADALTAFRRGLSVAAPLGEPAWYRAHVRAARGHLLIAVGQATAGAEELRGAGSAFRAMGASAFADRCTADVAGTSVPVTNTRDWLDELTTRERETAALVARGWTNKEIAEDQFVSPKTVEYHLRNTYQKLGISSRRELRDMLQARSPLESP